MTIGAVTVTLQAYLFNAFNYQIPIGTDEAWSIFPQYGYPDTIFDPNQEQENIDYGAVLERSDPRSFLAAVRVSF
jgi:hypothetical protein